jgi:bifunctional DNA-binding transcriptional regulator/antitoxin component of YhaV-PrlF toxin-antitoxin module
MSTLTITAKGQVTLRKELLRHLGVGPGDKINVDTRPDGRIEVSAVRKTGRISDVAGMLYREDGPCLTIEEINDAIGKGWAGELNGA